MSKSTQVNTGPTLRQFATLVDEGELIVTSKLGTSTLSRVRFKQLDFPSKEGEGAQFIRQRIQQQFPLVENLLGPMFDQCIIDQVKAVGALLSS